MARRLLIVLFSVAFGAGVLPAQDIRVEKVAEGLVGPEGPVWHPDGYLLFSDVHDAKILKLRPEGGTEVWFDRGLKTNGLVLGRDRTRLFACCYSERKLLEIDLRTRDYQVRAKSCAGREFNNVNDVAADAEGHVFFTDPKWGAKPGDVQGIYCYSADGSTTLAAALDRQPNGIGVTPDQKWVFVTRSGAKDIWRFRLERNGRLCDGEKWATVEAEPDGMTIDRNGNLYVALAGNGKLCVLSPEGRVLHLIKIAERMATNCEFAGEDESVVYVTCGGRPDTRLGTVWRVTFPRSSLAP